MPATISIIQNPPIRADIDIPQTVPYRDPMLVDLPHPVRVDAAFGRPMEEALFGPDFWTALKPYLGEDTLPTEWILNHVPGVYELARSSSNYPGTVNLGLLSLVLARARLRAHGDPVLQVHPALHEQLVETDLGAKLPVDLFRLPYTAAFIEFGRPSGLSIFNPASGEHEVEGAFVGSYQVGPHSFIFEKDDRRRHLGLDPEKPTRVIEIILTGSPRGKTNALDDASQNVALFLQDDDADLETAIERHFAFYRLPSAGSLPGFVPPDEREWASFEKAVYQLAKVMLYLNLPEAEQARRPDRSELLQRLRGLGPKKAARLQRKLARAYDRIVIGGRREAEGSAVVSVDGVHGTVRPHWRRGHFRRIRFGEGLTESRLGWIRPVLVNAAEAFAPVAVKSYEVR